MKHFTILFFILMLSVPQLSHAALIYLDPNEKTLGPGDIFIVDVRLDNEGECINAVHAEIFYSAPYLSVVDISRGTSFLNLWIEEPTVDEQRGVVSFIGGIPAGYCGRIQGDPTLSNTLATIVFQVPVTVGRAGDSTAHVRVGTNSEVLQNDGLGTPASLVTDEATFTISNDATEQINEWRDILLSDTVLPESFIIRLMTNNEVFDGKYYIVFGTTDKQSGLDYFEVEENEVWRKATSPHVLKDQTPDGEIRVRAYDKAGNERVETYIIEQPLPRVAPRQSSFLLLVGLLLGFGIVYGSYYVYKRFYYNDIPPTNTPSDSEDDTA